MAKVNVCHQLDESNLPESKFRCDKPLTDMSPADVVIDEKTVTKETEENMPLFRLCRGCFPGADNEVRGRVHENMHEVAETEPEGDPSA